jgi:hypothetical protein
MKTTGTVLGPSYTPFSVEMESSGQSCIKLGAAGEYMEFIARSPANAMVIRYSIPDSPQGDGIDAGIDLYRNGGFVRTLPVTSRYSWLYGAYPFSNDPAKGKPRNFYDECRVLGLNIEKGDVIRLQKPADQAAWCIIDLVDLEQVGPPRSRPANSLAPADFGTEALRACIAQAAEQHLPVWLPAGTYQISGEIIIPSGVTIQGAGMWHTLIAGDETLYADPKRRVTFTLTGSGARLADFAILGRLSHRDDAEANDGIIGKGCEDFTLSRLWIEHTKVGMWFYGCANGTIEECRLRNTRADGINFCTHSHHLTAKNCTARNTGDDCFAIWPAAFDHSHVQRSPAPGANLFQNCTGELSYLANGGAIYGGEGNRMEGCHFTDIAAGCGILISTTFPTADEAFGIDYGFSGTTLIKDCELTRCGGFDHEWGWRSAFQICLDRSGIKGIAVERLAIRDSLSEGFSIIGHGELTEARLDGITLTPAKPAARRSSAQTGG